MKLKDICIIQSGGTPSRSKKEYWENGTIPWVKISDFNEKYLNKTEETITEIGLKNSSAKIFSKGTILFTIFATLGEVSILNIDAATNQAIAGITITKPFVNTNYLYYFLTSLKEDVNKISRGVAQNNINMSILRDFEVPLPKLEEQIKISENLNKLDYLIKKGRRQCLLLDQLVKSRFTELFGDPIINSKNFDTKALKDILILKAGDFTAASDISDEQSKSTPYPCYGGNGIRGYVAEYNQEGEYSLVGRQGALSGNVQYASGKFKNTEHALLVTPIVEMNSIWLNQLLLNLDLKRYQTGAAQPGLSVKNLQEIQILCVPIDEQNQFAEFVKQSDKSKYRNYRFINLCNKLAKIYEQEWIVCQTLTF